MSTHILDRLAHVIATRAEAGVDTSYTAKLLASAPQLPARKLNEEATEVLIEALAGDTEKLAEESADLLYHLLVVWQAAGLRPQDVYAVLERREGLSGLDEKASRPSED
jgi:phosphoribosyl-ATP pyrophosphohydrolase